MSKEDKKIFGPDLNPFETYESINTGSVIKARYTGPLQGEVQISGAKNMVTKLVAASLSCSESTVLIENIPFIGDLDITLQLCKRLGVKYKLSPSGQLELMVGGFSNPNVLTDPYHGNRVAILFAGPVLSKLGEANISKPEGCNIGDRKINFHLDGLTAFGVDIVENGDSYSLRLQGTELKPASYKLPFPSVGATENLIITASCAQGESVIENCSIEPEIIQLLSVLSDSGVGVKILEPRTIIIEGRKHKITKPITMIPDRIEAASLAVAAISTRGDVFLRGAQAETLTSFIKVVQIMGGGVEVFNDGIRFFWKKELEPVSVSTGVYPGLPTDMQQPLAILMTQAEGVSSIHETIFEDRFKYAVELNRVAVRDVAVSVLGECPTGDPCRFDGFGYNHHAKINGLVEFGKGELEITDLRAGFALVNAAILSAEGIIVRNLKSLYRGYDDPVGKLKSLGANIELTI